MWQSIKDGNGGDREGLRVNEIKRKGTRDWSVGCKKSFMVRLIHVAWKCGCGLKQHTNEDQSFVNGSVLHAARSLLHEGGND